MITLDDKLQKMLRILDHCSSSDDPFYVFISENPMEQALTHALLSAVWLRFALEKIHNPSNPDLDAYGLVTQDLQSQSDGLAFSWEYDEGLGYTREAELYKTQINLLPELFS
jgi:hypothetical protein